jgi:hypothetical protein
VPEVVVRACLVFEKWQGSWNKGESGWRLEGRSARCSDPEEDIHQSWRLCVPRQGNAKYRNCSPNIRLPIFY